MKTAEEFYKEILAFKGLQEELKDVTDETQLEAFLKKHGCNATAKDFIIFINSKAEGEIADTDAALATGGSNPSLERFCKLKPHKMV